MGLGAGETARGPVGAGESTREDRDSHGTGKTGMDQTAVLVLGRPSPVVFRFGLFHGVDGVVQGTSLD